jgi:hypothetical protein
VSPKSRVLVRETADGTFRVLQVDARGREHEFRWTPAPLRLPKPTPPLASPSTSPVMHRPAADHPWRRQIHDWASERQAQIAQVAAGHP